jgi:hypothetical protein
VYEEIVPWAIERDGSSLLIHISCPVDDWEVLLEEAQRRLETEEGLTVIDMPTKIPGASRVDAEVLQQLRRVLGYDSGLPLRPA